MNEKLPGMTPDEFRRMTENGAQAWAGVDPADLRAGNFGSLPAPAAQDPEGLAHQIYSAAQLAPGEGVTDAVDRIAALLVPAAQEPLHHTVLVDWLAVRYRAAGGKEGITDLSAFCEEAMRWTETKHGITGAAK